MAYISQETKAAVTPAIKAVLKKFGITKASISTPNKMALCVTLRQGALDLMEDMKNNTKYELRGYAEVNPYHHMRQFSIKEHQDLITELLVAMKKSDWADNSDAMTDYFDISYYLTIKVGSWDKPYVHTA